MLSGSLGMGAMACMQRDFCLGDMIKSVLLPADLKTNSSHQCQAFQVRCLIHATGCSAYDSKNPQVEGYVPDALSDIATGPHLQVPVKSSATPRPEVQSGRQDGWLNVLFLAKLGCHELESHWRNPP